MKVTIITVTYNSERYLDQCIRSVINQSHPDIEHIIVDGGSSDSTLSIIEKNKEHISKWVSEKDNGLYHALQKGFLRSTGDIMGWLNSDDILQICISFLKLLIPFL